MTGHRPRSKRRFVPVIAFAALLAAVFLPGRSGLVSVIARWRRVRAHQRAIARHEQQLDSLRRVRDWLADPVNANERARLLLGRPDTLGR
uniref:Septum formation initiator family protein n=1 Tax=candidate division WOR-3 bacterium TaxID=2052148 RepID=A0A7C4G9Y1_UNCW3